MKKILVFLIALIMILGITEPSFASSWSAPIQSSVASPFAVEVIKLALNRDVTGEKYYTLFTDRGGFKPGDRIYYAVKLTLPSYSDANAYYGDNSLRSGSEVWVRIDYTNIVNKSSETYKVNLTDKAQTLWFDGKKFEEAWTASANNNCGCGDKHILNAEVKAGELSRIRVCIATRGEMSDVLIDGCYKVEEKSFRGVKPCPNCKASDLKGFLFSGDCAANKVFFSTNSKGKVTGAYCVDDTSLGNVIQNGAFEALDVKLYGWAPSGTEENCADGSCTLTFRLAEIPAGAKVNHSFYSWDLSWGNGYDQYIGKDSAGAETKGYFKKWVSEFHPVENGENVSEYDFDRLYMYENGVYKKALLRIKEPLEAPADARVAPYGKGDVLENGGYMLFWSDNLQDEAEREVYVFDTLGDKTSSMYPYLIFDGHAWSPSNYMAYGHIYYFKGAQASDAGKGRLFKMLATDRVDCDTNEASYLNSINHMLNTLGFTYEQMASGEVYMSKSILISNYALYKTACAEALWNH